RFTEVERIHRNHPAAFLLYQPASLTRESGSALVAEEHSDLWVRGITHLDRGQRPVVVESQTPVAESNPLHLLAEACIGCAYLVGTGFDDVCKPGGSYFAWKAFTQL